MKQKYGNLHYHHLFFAKCEKCWREAQKQLKRGVDFLYVQKLYCAAMDIANGEKAISFYHTLTCANSPADAAVLRAVNFPLAFSSSTVL